MSHANIVTVFDAGEDNGRPFIAMEYITGDTLATLIDQRAPLPLIRKLELMRDLSEGLSYAHAQNVVHRDIKPANLIIDGTGRLRILDFGIARMMSTGMTGTMVGTPSYMAPEQLQSGRADNRTDIFAVGVVLYELLSYQRAFSGNSQSHVFTRILTEEPPALRSICPDLDPAIAQIVERALQKNPEARYPSLTALWEDAVPVWHRLVGEHLEIGESTAVVPRPTPSESAPPTPVLLPTPSTAVTPPTAAPTSTGTTAVTPPVAAAAGVAGAVPRPAYDPGSVSVAWAPNRWVMPLVAVTLIATLSISVGLWVTSRGPSPEPPAPGTSPAPVAPTPPRTSTVAVPAVTEPVSPPSGLPESAPLPETVVGAAGPSASTTSEAVLAKCARGTPLVEAEMQALVELGVADDIIQRNVESCGVSFILSAASAARFSTLGASPAIVRLLGPPPSPAPGVAWTPLIDRRRMVWIGPGTFSMGSPTSDAGRDDDEAQHQVRIEQGYWIDTHEVTNEAFRRFVLANPQWQKARIDRRLHDGNYLKDWNGNSVPAGRERFAVAWVSWSAAQAYAAWAGKRLPTEAEWEYAARSGTTTPYWWGDEFDQARVTSLASVFAGGPMDTSPWRLAGMIGGLWEWTATRYGPYPTRASGANDPGPSENAVVRGGFYNSGPRFLRTANRSFETVESTSDIRGFRCAR